MHITPHHIHVILRKFSLSGIKLLKQPSRMVYMCNILLAKKKLFISLECAD